MANELVSRETLAKNGLMVLGSDMDLSSLTIEERAALLERYTAAQAADRIEDDLIDKRLHVVGMTLFQRDFVDTETGEIAQAQYVCFELADGRKIKTASTQAIPFATSVARILGYDPATGELPVPIYMRIKSAKAPQGFIYRFLFEGIAKK